MNAEQLRKRAVPGVQRALLWLCGAMLLVGSLAPPGYMPGSLSSGWVVVLCPEGLPPGFLQGHAHHHHHDSDASGGSTDAHNYCPLGSAIDKPAAIGAPLLLGTRANAYAPSTAHFDPTVAQPRPIGYHPRDPPQSAA